MSFLSKIIKWRLKPATRSACKTQHALFHAVQIHEPGFSKNEYLAKALDKRHKKNTHDSHVEYEDGGSIDFTESAGLIQAIKQILSIEFLPLLHQFEEGEKKEIMETVMREVDKYFSGVTCEEL